MKKLNKLLALVLAMVMTFGLSVTALGAWYDEAVKYVTEKGLMDKISETDFAPNTNADRATVVVALYRLAGSPEVTAENPFTDVAEDASYRNAVVWAYETKVTTGTSDTTFGPTEKVTREQFATFVWRHTKNCGHDVTVAEDFTLEKFKDAADVHSYAIDPILWACSNGLLQGSDSKLLPRDNTTRAQLATIVQRYAEMDFEAAEEKPEETIDLTDPKAILDKAFALKEGESLDGEFTLTGVITEINYSYSSASNDISVTMVIDGDTERALYCFRMKGEGIKDLIVGDTITVTGPIKNFKGQVEFDQAQMTAVEKTGKPVEAETDAAAILDKAYALAEGKSLSGTYTLTGVIIDEVEWSDKYQSVTFTMVVNGDTERPMLCYGVKGDGVKELVTGDTVTITGNIKNYKGDVEFYLPTLDSVG